MTQTPAKKTAAVPKAKKKTPAEKATEALGVEQRRVDKLEARHKELMDEAAALEPEIDAAKKRRDYLAQNPDLPATEQSTPVDTTPTPTHATHGDAS